MAAGERSVADEAGDGGGHLADPFDRLAHGVAGFWHGPEDVVECPFEHRGGRRHVDGWVGAVGRSMACLLYTSDAADE